MDLIYQNDGWKPANTLLMIRAMRGMQQAQVAKEIGIDIKKYRDMEKGYLQPDSHQLSKLADLFEVPIICFQKFNPAFSFSLLKKVWYLQDAYELSDEELLEKVQLIQK